jgi:tagaturonate epimerase
MNDAVTLGKYSIGVGDRFAHQAAAQLRACMMAAERGIEIVPVWNKSNREHLIVGSERASVLAAARAAVARLGWTGAYHVDADHIGLATVDRFIESSDFFTLDVADWIGKPAAPETVAAFVARHPELCRSVSIPGIEESFPLDGPFVRGVASKYLRAVEEAGNIYRHLERHKGQGRFITEVSMDETDAPQTPPELLVILAAIADQGIPAQTIAPKFTGRFNKGVDYVGDAGAFRREFAGDVATLAFAVRQYGLPANLKLSVHSGSDKFSIYAAIHDALAKFDAGVHVKTAGTTWLEELIGLAESGGKALRAAQEIYAEAYAAREALCAPYASVIDIDPARLPSVAEVESWSPERFVAALRHDPACPDFNPDLRQLLHVGYKVAAHMGPRYFDLLDEFEDAIARNVTGNLFERHIRPLFM